MKCSKCGSSNTHVVDSRMRGEDTDGSYRYRRYECKDCLFRFQSYEQYELGDTESSFKLAEIIRIITS